MACREVPGGVKGAAQKRPPPPPGGAPAAPLCPAAAQPDILAAYKLQRDRDFEDPYTGAGPGGLAPDARYGSPKHRLIKVDAAEKAPEEPAPEQVRAPRPARDRPVPAWLAAECGSAVPGERAPRGALQPGPGPSERASARPWVTPLQCAAGGSCGKEAELGARARPHVALRVCLLRSCSATAGRRGPSTNLGASRQRPQ
uniref:Uncharacterized protein n=1 Tax=Gopherus evgoodei TaxID=1825980 RepID=A0A8C4Y697_9SAUR